MELVIKKDVARSLDYDALAPFGVSRDSWDTWREKQVIDLGDLSANQMDDLEALLVQRKNVRGVGVLINDIVLWRKTLERPSTTSQLRACRIHGAPHHGATTGTRRRMDAGRNRIISFPIRKPRSEP